MVTLLVMHLTYFAANIIDGGQVQTSIAAGDQSAFQIGMQSFIPSLFGFVSVATLGVMLPTYCAQDCWLIKEKQSGEMYQFSLYSGGTFISAAYALGSWLYGLWSIGWFSSDYNPYL